MTHDPLPQATAPVAWPQARTSAPAVPLVDRMPDRLAARVILIGVAAGFLGQLLFFRQAGGINWVIWIAAVIGAAFVARRSDAKLERADLWLPLSALAFAGFMGIRDDAGLFLFDFVASGALTLASVAAIGGMAVTRSASITIARLGGAAIVAFWAGAAFILHGLRPLFAAAPAIGGSSTSRRILRGLLIALPLVIGFVVLFAAADAVFQSLVRNAFSIRVDLADWIGRLTFAILAGWLFAGTLVTTWLSRERFLPDASGAQQASAERHRPLSTVEAITVLGVLDALFAIFVVIQAAYLFPGTNPLEASGLTYAEYARRGFFELVVVAVMSGLVILCLDWLIERATLAYRVAAVSLALLTGAVLISATVRLALYQQAYGWTELRFYVLAAIALLAACVVATIAAIAIRRVQVIPRFVLGAGLAVALVCNFIGPQAFAADQNLQRVLNPSLVPADGYAGLDIDYLGSLGPDAIPAFVAALDRLPVEQRGHLSHLLRDAATTLRRQAETQGWQSWNLSRQRALDALTAAGF